MVKQLLHLTLSLIILVLAMTGSGCATVGSRRTAPEGVQDTAEVPEEERDRTSGDPLFSITGVVLHISRISPDTVIILPQTSFIRDYLRDEPFTATVPPAEGLPSNRFRFRFQVNTTAVPPFVLDRDRYLYPDLYD